MLRKLRRTAVIAGFVFVTAIAVSCVSSPEIASPANGIVAWLHGDGGITDLVADRRTWMGGTVGYAPGVIGSAFKFQGKPGSVSADIDMASTNEFTIELLLRQDELGDHLQACITAAGECHRGRLTAASLNSAAGEDSVIFEVVFGDESYGTRADYVLNQGEFHHVAGTYGAGTLRLYFDGTLVDTADVPDRPVCFDWVELGNFNLPVNGLIDELKIHDRALEPQEIATAFSAVFPDREPHLAAEDDESPGPQGFLWRWMEEYPAEPKEILERGLGTVSFTVFPTVVHLAFAGEDEDEHDVYRQIYEAKSAEILSDFLVDNNYASAVTIAGPIELPAPQHDQGSIVGNGLSALRSFIQAHPLSTDYLIVVEVVIVDIPWDEDGEGVWTIQSYVMNSSGEDAGSLVLNGQWGLFIEANLFAGDRTEASHGILAVGAVRAVAEAIQSHLTGTWQKTLPTPDPIRKE